VAFTCTQSVSGNSYTYTNCRQSTRFPAPAGKLYTPLLTLKTSGGSGGSSLSPALTNISITLSIAPPVLISVVPAVVPAGGGAMWILGAEFGSITGAVVVITVDGVACPVVAPATTTWVNATALRCTAPVAPRRFATLMVTVDGQQSAPLTIEYALPSLASVQPAYTWNLGANAAVNAAGSVVVAPLVVYGVALGTASSLYAISVFGQFCPTITWLNNSAVRCAGLVGTAWVAGNANVTVYLSGGTVNATAAGLLTLLDPPFVTAVNPSLASAGNTVTSTASTNMAAGKGSPWRAFAALVGVSVAQIASGALVASTLTACTTFTNTVVDVVTCQLPRHPASTDSASLALVLELSDGLRTFSGLQPVTYVSPTVASFTAATYPLPQVGGVQVFFTGTNLGVSGVTPIITLGSTTCASPTWISATSVRCTPAAGTFANMSVTVSIDGLLARAPFNLTYATPTITSVTPPWVYTQAGYSAPTLTVRGISFGAVAADATAVTFGGVPCASLAATPSTAVTTIVCSGLATGTLTAGTNVTAAVRIGSWPRSEPDGFGGIRVVTPPAPTVVSPTSAQPGTVVTITLATVPMGGVFSAGMVRVVAGTPNWASGMFPCAPLVDNGATVACTVPSMDASPGNVFAPYVVLRDTSAAPVLRTSGVGVTLAAYGVAAPTITSISPATLPQAGGSVTITGTNFGLIAPLSVAPASGTTVCSAIARVSSTQATCTVVAGTGTGLPLGIAIDGVPSANFPVSYAAPAVTGTLPAWGFAYPNHNRTVHIYGTNFGNTAADLTAASIGGVGCRPAMRLNSTTIMCASVNTSLWAGSAAGLAATASVSIAGFSSAATGGSFVVYTPPTVASVTPDTQEVGRRRLSL
jgi:hypothetical protein